MSEQERSFFGTPLESMTGVYDLIGRLFRVAEPGAVYSEPIVSGDRTVIVTSELSHVDLAPAAALALRLSRLQTRPPMRAAMPPAPRRRARKTRAAAVAAVVSPLAAR